MSPAGFNQHAKVCKNGCRTRPAFTFCARGWQLLQKMARSEEARLRAKKQTTWTEMVNSADTPDPLRGVPQ